MLLLFFLFLQQALSESVGVFDLRDYGGRGDGSFLNTAAFARVISVAHAYYSSTGSSGVVLIENGVYLSGQVVMLSGVTLNIAPGTRLLASSNSSDFPTDQSKWAFIYSEGATSLAITGGGVVDGAYQDYIGGFSSENDEFIPRGWANCEGECRPRLVKLTDSTAIIVSSVTFTGSPDWTFHLLNCTDVHVYNWTQWGDERWPNNDGIDIDSSSHVVVEDSTIDTADDGVCIKGSAVGGQSVNVTVRRMLIRSRSSAVKFGSNCPIHFSNHTYEDLTIHDSNRGLALQARDGGVISDVVFRRVTINGTRFWPWHWWGDGGAIYISSMLRDPSDPGTRVERVVFEDVTALSENSAVLSGVAPGRPLTNITLRRVNLTLTKLGNYSTSNVSGPSIEYDPHPPGVPSRVSTVGWMSGLYVEGVQGLRLEDVFVTFDASKRQSYWGRGGCLNTTLAGFPIVVVGGGCVPPPL